MITEGVVVAGCVLVTLLMGGLAYAGWCGREALYLEITRLQSEKFDYKCLAEKRLRILNGKEEVIEKLEEQLKGLLDTIQKAIYEVE
jgi:hypothetical protein